MSLIELTNDFVVPKHDNMHNKLNSAIQEVSNYYDMLQEREKQALRTAMIEERSRFCTLFTLVKPVMVSASSEEILLFNECLKQRKKLLQRFFSKGKLKNSIEKQRKMFSFLGFGNFISLGNESYRRSRSALIETHG